MIEYQLDDCVNQKYEKPTVISLLKCVGSSIAFDVAPQHTGIVIWNGETTEEYGFALADPNKSDYHWLYNLRKEFKQKVIEIVKDRHFENCIIEGVYGGENYNTTEQLLEINDVIDELIDENYCTVTNFYRLRPTEWMAKYRTIYKQSGKLVSKLETQGLLDYLEYDFYKKYKDYPESSEKEAKRLGVQTKKEIFFEDICDACGMLIAIAAMNTVMIKDVKPKKHSIKNVKMVYLEHLEDCKTNRDKRIKTEDKELVTLGKNLKDSVLTQCLENEDKVMYAELPVSKLGTFGIENKFTFYKSGQGYLVFYLKPTKKS